MKLYVCWNTSPGPGSLHPCGRLIEACARLDMSPRQVIKARGLGFLPERFNRTEGRRDAKRLTGSMAVPVLVTDAGEVVADSTRIVAWAREHPVGQA